MTKAPKDLFQMFFSYYHDVSDVNSLSFLKMDPLRIK